MTYEWDFDGDGTIDERATDVPTAEHTYDTRGRYSATLRVTNGDGNVSDPAKVEVFPGDEPPEPAIDSLTEASVQPTEPQAEVDAFRVGTDYTATGSASDPDGDVLVELTWEVVQSHDNNHVHPFENATGDGATFSGPKPEGLYSTNPDENYVEVRLTATDSLGLSKTVVRRLPPRTTDLTFKTEPAGLRVDVAGKSLTSPRTITSWEGYDLNVLAPRQRKDGRTYALRAWSDGETATERVVETPEQSTEYTAAFRRLRR